MSRQKDDEPLEALYKTVSSLLGANKVSRGRVSDPKWVCVLNKAKPAE